MVEKKEEDNQQEEIKEPDSENIENEEDINDSQENTYTEEKSEDENHPESIKNLIDGLKMVLKEYKSTLEKHGVKKIETLNQKFDHNFHQAMMEVENNDVEEGTVVQEVQSGYTMHDRLLRAAMVGVSKKPVTKTEDLKEKEVDNPENENKENT